MAYPSCPPPLVLILIAGTLLELYLLPYFAALKQDETSRVVPLFQFVPIFVFFLSTIFLGETLTTKQLLGFVLVTVGGFFLAAEKIDYGLFKPRKSFWFMMLASLMYAVVGILFRAVVVQQDFWTVLSYQYIGMGIASFGLFLLPSVRKAFRESGKAFKTTIPLIATNNSIAIVAQMSESYAIALAPVILVNMLTRTQPFFILLYGLILTKYFPNIAREDVSKSVLRIKIFAISVMFLGLLLI